MRNLVAFLAAYVFAIGLGVAGMTRPSKVIGFLDVFGAWDASLLFVMIGAIGVYMPLYKLIRRRKTPLLDKHFFVPEKRPINVRLLAGSAIFGVGWGLGGYCPGPAMTGLASGSIAAVVFVAAMLVGMALFAVMERRRNPGAHQGAFRQSDVHVDLRRP